MINTGLRWTLRLLQGSDVLANRFLSAVRRTLLVPEPWSLDVDLRYLPVVRFLKENHPTASLLEVGSSSTGITPYVRSIVVGADVAFPGSIAEQLIPVVTRYPLPFRDSSFDVVVSLDTFEHIPREFRQNFITELIRTAKRCVSIGFPEGSAAEEHDAAMEQYFTRQNGAPHPYFVEHREYGVPKEGEFERYVKHSASVEQKENCTAFVYSCDCLLQMGSVVPFRHVLSFLLIRSFGFFGAVTGTALSAVIGGLLFFHWYGKRLMERPLSRLFSIAAKPLMSGLLAVLVCEGVASFMHTLPVFDSRVGGLLIVIVAGLIFVALYVILLVATKVLTADDKAFFINIIPNRFAHLVR